MTAAPKDELPELLIAYARKHGVGVVVRACRDYLKTGRMAGTIRTPRKRINRSWILEALDRQGGACKRCGNPLHINEATGDHTIPLGGGGKHTKWNVSAMHRGCNSSKGSNTPLEESKATGTTIEEILK
jgi:5-methylcytosine-specific restriction endonuclease McrA